MSLPHPLSSTAPPTFVGEFQLSPCRVHNSLITLGSLLNKAWNKRSVEEKFNKGWVKRSVFLSGGVESLVLNLNFGAKKIYDLTIIIFQARFKRATVNNSGGKETQHANCRNFWNLSTKVGAVARRKFGPNPQFGSFRIRS